MGGPEPWPGGGSHMGQVIGFPEQTRTRDDRPMGMRLESARVIILPVIRIERYDEEPAAASRSQRRRRRRRAARSNANA
jgi:hypothetical protein